jgi:hypothetical protein
MSIRYLIVIYLLELLVKVSVCTIVQITQIFSRIFL